MRVFPKPRVGMKTLSPDPHRGSGLFVFKMKRVGFIGIVVENRKRCAPKVNELLSEYGDIIVGRMGIPYPKRDINVITLIVDGTTDEIGALTGKLGMIKGVTVKSGLSKINE